MAKKKSRGPGRPKKSAKDTKEYALTIRASKSWKEWLQEFAEFCRCDMVNAIDKALVGEAERQGFRKPPKR